MAVPELVGPIGASATKTTSTADYSLGTLGEGKDGSRFVYVQANGAINAGDVVILTEAWQADQIDLSNSNAAAGDKCGVARTGFANDDYGWVQIFGTVDAINVLSDAAANTKLHSTATAGLLDDEGTTGAEYVEGLYLTAAETADQVAPGQLNFPYVGATLT